MLWLAWDELCGIKNERGLDFRSLEEFNKALGTKQGWRLMYNENNLAAKVLKSKFFPNSSFLETNLKGSISKL